MLAKYIQDGKYIDYTPTVDITAGDIVVIGSIVGIANHDIAAGETGIGAICIEGVIEVPTDGTAITAGAVVYWNATAKQATLTSTGNTLMGKSITAATATDEVVRVKLG